MLKSKRDKIGEIFVHFDKYTRILTEVFESTEILTNFTRDNTVRNEVGDKFKMYK
jgi:hypothetical protein